MITWYSQMDSVVCHQAEELSTKDASLHGLVEGPCPAKWMSIKS